MGKWFPTLYDTFMQPLEERSFQKVRQQLIRDIEGSILEIGCGTGLNFPFYMKASDVTAIDPSPEMLHRAKSRIQLASVPIHLKQASAEELPFEANTFDNIVCTLVLCTVPTPEIAIQEMIRVIKPGGRIYLFEHVKVEHPVMRALQELLTPMWKHLCDGCHLNRDTVGLVEKSGLRIVQKHYMYKGIFVTMTLESDETE